MEKREPSYTVCNNVNLCSHYEKQNGGSLKKLKIESPYDLAIAFLGIYLDKTIIQKGICAHMYIVQLVTTAKTWKHSKCP